MVRRLRWPAVYARRESRGGCSFVPGLVRSFAVCRSSSIRILSATSVIGEGSAIG